jgi:hypothetical protein
MICQWEEGILAHGEGSGGDVKHDGYQKQEKAVPPQISGEERHDMYASFTDQEAAAHG